MDKNVDETGSALKKRPQTSLQTQRTPENIKAVRFSIGRNPPRSLRKHVTVLIPNNRAPNILHYTTWPKGKI